MARKSTRGAQGNGSIRKKTVIRNGKEYTYWEGRCTLGTDPGTGKQKQKSFSGKTQAEVRKKLQAATTAIDNGEYAEPSKLTISKWVDIWLVEYMGDKKYLTAKGYKAQCNTHIKPNLGAVKLSALAPHDIQKFYNKLLAEGKTVKVKDEKGKVKTENKPLSAKSVRNVHGILTKCLSVAVNLGYIKSNPATRVTIPRVEKTEIQPLTDAQIEAFIKAVDDDEYGDLLRFILFTGVREAEGVGLTWDNVDLKSVDGEYTGTVTICKQLQKRPKADGGFQFASLKNDKVRTLTPAPFVMELLNRRRIKQIEARLRAGGAWEAWKNPEEQKKALVFTNALGQHLHPQTVYNHLKKIVIQIGAPAACVHDLRHTFAVLSLQNGDDVKTLQENLGHATAAFTLDKYGHVSERMKQESANRMQKYIKGISNL